MNLAQSDSDYFNCKRCGDFSAPVVADGSEWCRKCGTERVNMVCGDDIGLVSHDTYTTHTVARAAAASAASAAPATAAPATSLPDKVSARIRQDMERICETNDIPAYITDSAIATFLKVHEKRETRGAVQRALMANCLYRACIAAKVPRTCIVVKRMFDVTSKKFNEAEKIYAEHCGVGAGHRFDIAKDYGIAGSMFRHAAFLDDSALCHKAIRLLEQVMSKTVVLHGKSPDKLAAAAILALHVTLGKSLCKQCDGRGGLTCPNCISFACENFFVSKATLVAQCKAILAALTRD